VNVTGVPDSLTQIVNGSEPSCSVVKPCSSVTVPGKVTGTVSLQAVSAAVTLTPVMVLAVVSRSQDNVGWHASLFIRAINRAASYLKYQLNLTYKHPPW
jgi:hypothetical protein